MLHLPDMFKCRRKQKCIISAVGSLLTGGLFLTWVVFGFTLTVPSGSEVNQSRGKGNGLHLGHLPNQNAPPKEKTMDWQMPTSIYEFGATDIDGNLISLEKYRGYVVIITNVASKYVKNLKIYSRFAQLHAKYAEKGLRILAFPSDQFANKEPGNETQNKQFAEYYHTQYDMFSKIEVNGENAHPLWKWLKNQSNGEGLFGKHGQLVKRYGPLVDLRVLEMDLPKYL